ncbi:MAG: ABC transporter permease [Bacteriovoracaceae bacterium]|nr:ABC transporter permease [Bacteriovoracaceae bacterium]
MVFKLGFRNILRNKRRTIITCMIMGLGLAALIFADAFLRGLNQNMIDSVTNSFIGDGQIHRKEFLKTRELEKTILNTPQVLSDLNQNPLIRLSNPRTIASAMIASPTDVLPVALYGIKPLEESLISSIKESIIAGDYLNSYDQEKILIGEKLAKFLGASVGDKLVVTTSQAKTGILSQELFRVGGIFKMKNKDMDSSMAFINMEKSQSFMGIGTDVHEIVFKFKNRQDVVNPPNSFLEQFSANDNEALSWKKLVPAIDAGIQLTTYSLSIGSIILFAVIALSTMNTLFMSIYERMYEFGIMKAIGTRATFIFKLIVLEAGSLALVSSFFGLILGNLLTVLTRWTGINHLTDVEYLGTTIKTAIRPVFHSNQWTVYPLAIIIFAILAALYPAFSAARIIPTKSMRRD